MKNAVPITYRNNKVEKKVKTYRELWEVAFWGFDTKIGSITNDSTTTFEIQSQFEIGTKEYEELNKRLKLFRYFQGNEIDRAKNGSKKKKFPKSWNTYQIVLDTDSQEEIERKVFENKLIIEKRPAFMRFLYPKYEKEYKDFLKDFDRYSITLFGKKYNEVIKENKKSDKKLELIEYYNKKNPLLETRGVMNRISLYMQSKFKGLKQSSKNTEHEDIFKSLYNDDIELDDIKLNLLIDKKKEYEDFKKTNQLKLSTFATYEQYYKYLRNDCLEKISNNIQELANLSVYICYYLYHTKPKDFCWDVFGVGIVENLKLKNNIVQIPYLSEKGSVTYLGKKYEMLDIKLISDIDKDDLECCIDTNIEDMFNEFEDLE